MKQLLFVLFISSCSSPLFAQLRLGIQGGLNMAKFLPVNKRESSLPESYKTDWYRGGQIGIVTEYGISKVMSIRSGLLINGKGTVMNSENSFDTSKRDIELHYLELPVVFTYKKKVSATSFVLAGAGLYLARAVRGIETGKGNSFSGPFYIGDKVMFANENEDQSLPTVIKPLDWGYTALAGVEHKRLQLTFNYTLSGSPILPNPKIYYVNFKNAVATLSLAYFVF